MVDLIWEPTPARAPQYLYDALPDVPPLVVHLAAWRLRLSADTLSPGLHRHETSGNAAETMAGPWPDVSAIYNHLYAAETAPLPPCLIPHLQEAAQRLVLAVQRDEAVGIHGDYDVDGVTSAALLTLWLRGFGVRVETILPNRGGDGYGLSGQALERLAEHGCRLVVAVDCGITAVAEAQRARDLDLELIVLDHHAPGDVLPATAILVDPKLPEAGSSDSDRNLAAVGLAYRLCEAMVSAGAGVAATLAPLLDLVALGTIADVCPLTGANRLLVARGLTALRHSLRPGILALARSAGVGLDRLTAEDVAFRLGPRLNAAGRLADPRLAFDLLTTDSMEQATAIAAELERLNRRRQDLTEAAVASAIRQLGNVNGSPKLLIATGDDWHLGIVGLVAGKLVQQYQRPALALTAVGDTYVGSARSVDGFDIAAALRSCRDLLVQGGGHARAAGLTLAAAGLESLRHRLVQLAEDELKADTLTPRLRVDAKVRLQSLTPAVLRDMERLGPFGEGNPPPHLLAENVAIAGSKLVGKTGRHAQVRLRQAGTVLSGVQFHIDPTDLPQPGSQVDALFVPVLDQFQGVERIELRLVALRPSTAYPVPTPHARERDR